MEEMLNRNRGLQTAHQGTQVMPVFIDRTVNRQGYIDHTIAAARVTFPDLSPFGFGRLGVEPFDHHEIETAITFLLKCRKVKRAVVSSYYLKHAIEGWGKSVGLAPYVTNGAAIVAAHALGFTIARSGTSPNAGIGVKQADVKKIHNQVESERLMAARAQQYKNERRSS
jgi:hypothetical protein